ncbi:MAG TPA: cytochrome C [Candidatus Binatia bacterium]|nr:cytochrome C [Candidatus Binatia bacterium]
MKHWAPLAATAAFVALAVSFAPVRSATPAELARGKMLVVYGSCNDCHTPGWVDASGAVPVSGWLIGNSIGFLGPWGTVYPANVRLRFAQITEEQWLFMVRTRAGHPPMKWTDLRALSVDDQRAIYRFVRSLGAAGSPAPISVPPGKAPNTPFYNITPQRPGERQAL